LFDEHMRAAVAGVELGPFEFEDFNLVADLSGGQGGTPSCPRGKSIPR
jgi:hypothetical protein